MQINGSSPTDYFTLIQEINSGDKIKKTVKPDIKLLDVPDKVLQNPELLQIVSKFNPNCHFKFAVINN